MKGMRKIARGTGFRGVVDYAFERTSDKDAGRLVGGNMSGADPRSLAAEFGNVRALRPNIEKPVWHNSLRLPAGDKINDEVWRQIADSYMQKMGFSDLHPRVYVMHDDKEGQHIHIVASRIALDGKLYLGQNENLKSTSHIADLEKEFALRVTKNADYVNGKPAMPAKKTVKKGELEKALATGERPPRVVLQEIVSDAMKNKPNTSEFLARLDVAGVTVVPNIASTGTMNGFSFEFAGVPFSGSKLGDDYKWNALKKRIDYDEIRDSPELARRRDAARSSRKNDSSAGADEQATRADRDFSSSDRTADRSADAVDTAHEIDRSAPDGDRSVDADRQRQEAAADREQKQRTRDPRDDERAIERAAFHVQEIARPAVARDIDLKVKAWRAQHAALDAPLYEISMRDSAGKTRVLEACSAAIVEEKMQALARYEKRGRDVQIRAIDPQKHFIHLHDLTASQLEALHAAGYTPALVLQPGQTIYSAIVAAERTKHADDAEIMRDVARTISTDIDNVKIGVDVPMPLANFKQRSTQQKRTIARIISAAKAFCQRTQQMLRDALRSRADDVARAAAAEAQAKRRAIIMDPTKHPLAGQVRQYMMLAREFFTKFPTASISEIDVKVARVLLKDGLARDEVERPIAAASPGAVAYGVNATEYARATLDKALAGGGGGGISASPNPRYRGPK